MIRDMIREEAWWLIPAMVAYDLFIMGVAVGRSIG